MTNPNRYRAPALEKGLEIIELLARSPRPLGLSEISSRLKRSTGELFRMLRVLEDRKFVQRKSGANTYVLAERVFHLAVSHAPSRPLLECAVPVMHELTTQLMQGCHLCVVSEEQAVVVASVENPDDTCVSIPLGLRRSLGQMTAGVVLFGFQDDEVRIQLLLRLGLNSNEKTELLSRANRARDAGFLEEPSPLLVGVTELSVPIVKRGSAIAALTIPCVRNPGMSQSRKHILAELQKAASRITDAMTAV